MDRSSNGRGQLGTKLIASLLFPLLASGLLGGCGERTLDIKVRLVASTCPDRDGQTVNALRHVDFIEVNVSGDGISETISRRSSVGTGEAVIADVPVITDGREIRRRIDVIGRSGRPDGPPQSLGSAVVIVDDKSSSMEVPIFMRPLDSFAFTASAGAPDTCSVMNRSRSGHTATVLRDGRVLIVGGALIEPDKRIVHRSAEIFDPKTGDFVMLEDDAAPELPRVFHTATLLRDGRVLVAGGEYDSTANGVTTTQAHRNAEIFDPKVDAFTEAIAMPRGRTRHTATAAVADMVVLIGGYSDPNPPPGGDHPLPTNTVDIFLAGDDVFESSIDLPEARAEHCALSAQDGTRVVIAGGKTDNGGGVETEASLLYFRVWPEKREIVLLGEYNMRTGRHGLACGTTRREGASGEQIIMAGGFRSVAGGDDDATANVELFDSAASQVAQNLGALDGGPRGWLCAAQLDTSSIAFIGGYRDDSSHASGEADRLVPAEAGPIVEPVQAGLNDGRYHHRCTVLLDGSVLVTGGERPGAPENGELSLDSAEIFTPRSL